MTPECIAIVGAISTVIAGFGGAALGACFAHKTGMKLVRKTHENDIDIMQRQETIRAASKFRAGIIYELTSFYPIDHHWEERDFIRLYQSTPKFKSICTEFRFFVKSKDDFDATVKDYDEYCRKTKYEELIPAWERFPNTYFKQPGDIAPKERFKILVDHLLSFADEN